MEPDTTPLSARPLPLVEISGADPRERGRQYGEQTRDLIDRSLAFYREEFERKSGLAWADVVERVPRWYPLIDDYLPGALDEVRGIAEASGRTVEQIVALNGRGELRTRDPFAEATDCTSFVVTDEASGDGHVWCGQNWDWRSETAGTAVMLRIRQPGKPRVVTLVEAGQVARHGASSAGIALNANGLAAPFQNGLGVPAPFIRRKTLESAGMDQALDAIFSSRQLLSTNILLTHRDGFAIDIETTPARHGWAYPQAGVYAHANAFTTFVPPQVRDSYRPASSDSLIRAERVERTLRRAPEAHDSPAMRALIVEALSDHLGYPNSVCNHADPRAPRTFETLASVIVDLTTGDFWVAGGNPCTTAFELLPWNLYEDAERPARELAHAEAGT
jgi:isopenicillin-N N-acyltransferase-like protein